MIKKICDKYNISNYHEKLLVLTEEEIAAFLDEDEEMIALMQEPLDIFLTRFGIAEWSKKSICLGSNDSEKVLRSLGRKRISEDEDCSLLLHIAMLPFPKFVNKYFRLFPASEVYLRDPAFGYKLYLSNVQEMGYLVNVLKGEVLDRSDHTSIINERYMTPDVSLSQYMKEQRRMSGSSDGKKGFYQGLLWFLHLSKYIDAEEAEKLGLSYLHTANGYCGFELDNKLGLLNEVPREILKDYFGYSSGMTMNFDDIIDKYHITRAMFKKLLDECLPYMMNTTAVFKAHLKNKTYPESVDGFQTYTNPTMESADIKINIDYYWHLLNDKQREIIDIFSDNRHKYRYLILSYLFLTKDINKLMDMPFYLSKADIQLLIEMWKNYYSEEFEKAAYCDRERKIYNGRNI